MEMKDFYTFGSKLMTSTFQAAPVETDESQNDLIPLNKKLIKGNYQGIIFPILFKQEYGKKLADVLDTGHVSLFLISEKLKNALDSEKITGWKTYPVQVLDKKGSEVKGYYGFSIVGICGPIDYSQCEIFEKKNIPTGPLCKYYRGLPIGLDKWDGSDFFLPEGTCHIIITPKVVEMLKKNKFTNIELKNLADTERPDYAVSLISQNKL